MSDRDYIGGVFESTNKLITFIDPNDLNMSNPHSAANITAVRDSLNLQQAGFGTRLNQTSITNLIDRAINRSPSAIARQVPENLFDPTAPRNQMIDTCLVVKQDFKSDDKADIVEKASGTPTSLLKNIPGSEALWDRLLGVHEGKHCEDNPPVTITDILIDETDADMASIEWLKNGGNTNVAEALIDYRILGSVHKNDIVHSNGFALQLGGVSLIDADYMKAAQSIRLEVLGVIRDEHGVGSIANALKYIGKFPERCVETVEKALFNGEFKDATNPNLELHIHAYTQAFRRKMNGVSPLAPLQKNNITSFNQVDLNNIKGGDVNIDLASGDSSSMTIGAVSAPEFFASIAHPDLANQRIVLQEASIDPALDFPINQNNVAAMAV